MAYEKVDMDMVSNKTQWSTWYDVNSLLVLHVTIVMKKIYVDKEVNDPDGIPLVFFDPQLVTRVRKMTTEELDMCLKKMIKTEEIIIDKDDNNERNTKDDKRVGDKDVWIPKKQRNNSKKNVEGV